MTRERWTQRLVATAFWLGAFALSVSTYNIVNDHFDRISRARQIAWYGALPFRDFLDPGYFMTEFISAGLQFLLGDNLWGEMLLNTVLIASGVTVVLLLARRVSGSYLAGITAALLVLLSMPRAYDFDNVFFYPLGIALCWRYIDRPGARRVLELAAGIAIGALFRYDTGVYIGLAAVVTMLALHWREPAVVVRRIGVCAVAAALCGLAVLVPVVGVGGVRDAIDQVVTYAVKERSRTNVGGAPRFSLGSVVGKSSIPPPVASVTVRWSEVVDDARRLEAESRYEPLWIRAQRLVPPLQWQILPDAWNDDNASAFLYYFLWGLPLESESVPIIIALAGDEKVFDEYSLLTRYIDEYYKVAARTNFDGPDAEGDYLVLVRKDRPPTRTDSLTALPCFD